MGQPHMTGAGPSEARQVPMDTQALGDTALSNNAVPYSLPGGSPFPSPPPSSLNSSVVDSFVTHRILNPADFPPLPLPSNPLPLPTSTTTLPGAPVPFPPLVFPDSARAGLNFHADQPHLFGECPGEPSQLEKVLLMVFFDHTVVAVTPKYSSKEGVHPPGFKVCGGTAILFHGDALHATSLPGGYGGERRGM